MSMLARYQKPGGFLQLLNVIETSGPAKQEKFLSMIREEDPRWSDAIERKMLSIAKIWAWEDPFLAEVIGCLQDLTLAVSLHGMDAPMRERCYKLMSQSRRRKIDELFETNSPTATEISAVQMKVIVEVRKVVAEGKLRLEQIHPDLAVENDIEDILKKGPAPTRTATTSNATTTANIATADTIDPKAPVPEDLSQYLGPVDQNLNGSDPAVREEMTNLRRKVIVLGQENNQLKQEVHKLKTKIEQIKKIV